MNEQKSRLLDQADDLRKKVDKRTQEDKTVSPSFLQGTLPPRSSVHPKPPPLNKAPFYIGGIVLLAAVLGGGYWWYTVSKQSASTAPAHPAAQTTTEAKNNTSTANEKPENKSLVPVAPSSQQSSAAPAKQAIPPVAKPPAAKPPTPVPAVKPPIPAPAAKLPTPVPAVKPPIPAPAVVHRKKTESVQKRKNRVLRHRVQPGDTLFRISMMYYKTGKYQGYLARYNHVSNTGNILTGTIIKVPVPPR